MAKTSMKVKQQRAPKFSTRAYTRCTISVSYTHLTLPTNSRA